jgi:hypothetical protein
MKGFKGFDPNMRCNGKQYEVGKEFTEGHADLCKSGIHFCEHPLDVFGYYPPASSVFCEVESPDECVSKQTDCDTKRVTTKLSVGAKLDLHAMISAAIQITFDRAKDLGKTEHATGYQGAASATGDQGAASATGDQGAASATGDQGAASATGTRGAASATGYQGAASALGIEGKAKGNTGCWLTLAEWEYRKDGWHRIKVKTTKVDGKKIKADTFYCLKDGKFTEAQS